MNDQCTRQAEQCRVTRRALERANDANAKKDAELAVLRARVEALEKANAAALAIAEAQEGRYEHADGCEQNDDCENADDEEGCMTHGAECEPCDCGIGATREIIAALKPSAAKEERKTCTQCHGMSGRVTHQCPRCKGSRVEPEGAEPIPALCYRCGCAPCVCAAKEECGACGHPMGEHRNDICPPSVCKVCGHSEIAHAKSGCGYLLDNGVCGCPAKPRAAKETT